MCKRYLFAELFLKCPATGLGLISLAQCLALACFSIMFVLTWQQGQVQAQARFWASEAAQRPRKLPVWQRPHTVHKLPICVNLRLEPLGQEAQLLPGIKCLREEATDCEAGAVPVAAVHNGHALALVINARADSPAPCAQCSAGLMLGMHQPPASISLTSSHVQ